jgi:hypothetical protein
MAAENALLKHHASSEFHVPSNKREVRIPYEQEWMVVSHNDTLNASDSFLTPKVGQSADANSSPEIADLNPYTNSVEFHGYSSSVAILCQVQKDCGEIGDSYSLDQDAHTPSLISALHNPGFSPQSPTAAGIFSPEENGYYQDQAVVFMESYFDTLHYVHPIINKDDFTTRAKNLWLSGSSDSNFVPLYYSLLSLGALVRIWDELELLGMTRFEWSRKLFQHAQYHLEKVKFSNELDNVQCLFLMV